MRHVGVTIGRLDPAIKFYHDILGFQQTWRGSSTGKILSWVNMRRPHGHDYLQFLLYTPPRDPAQVGSKNHICLITPQIAKAGATLKARPPRQKYTPTTLS